MYTNKGRIIVGWFVKILTNSRGEVPFQGHLLEVSFKKTFVEFIKLILINLFLSHEATLRHLKCYFNFKYIFHILVIFSTHHL